MPTKYKLTIVTTCTLSPVFKYRCIDCLCCSGWFDAKCRQQNLSTNIIRRYPLGLLPCLLVAPHKSLI
ncbi:hypothetical protein MBAV_003151 [Candidatus Magnetobacterium bavaricum]|uniref:Uncharacterized protein n=1 Tax=Candidatus Magnetobacterium bavaricum TaxID=29290 RepID=A0A0F3GRR6_9BACT|nr:hypothetical protein MBAV_003151 [Candidatus Magnetobacterium bavaricum]